MLDRGAPWIALLLLTAAVGLAAAAAGGDSVTVDEPIHVTAGYATLTRGDFRLSPDHPPLARALLALPWLIEPLLGRAVHFPVEETRAWQRGDFFTIGDDAFSRWNDGQQLIRSSRVVAIAFLAALLATIATIARTLFGRAGALIALALASFDPAWLAHGHLATIDVPFALSALLVLLAAHRWLAQPSPLRLVGFAASFAACTLVKFSWPTLLPALAAMVVIAGRSQRGASPAATAQVVLGRLAFAASVLALTSAAAIWAAYGFRFSTVASGDPAELHVAVPLDRGQPPPKTAAEAWEVVLHDPATATDRSGPLVPLLRTLHAHRLLPEAYLFGLAYVAKKADNRAAYLRGAYDNRGFPTYFPWALAVKTPLPALLMFAGGLLATLRRWHTVGAGPLGVGLTLFAVTYAAVLGTSGLNLGYRHLLPVTAVLAIAAGGLGQSLLGGQPSARATRWLAVGLVSVLLWLGLATVRAAPHFLGYFNVIGGGWENGHRQLADSNLDWGQDLLRLRTRLASEPATTTVWLAQAGDPPLPRNLSVRRLLGSSRLAPAPEAIGAGLYVISATELVGVYRPLARAASWRDPALLGHYQALVAAAATRRRYGADTTTEPPGVGHAATFPDELETLRRLRLIPRLLTRKPDERIGTSLFLFRLRAAEVAEWTAP